MATNDHPLKKLGYVLIGLGTSLELYASWQRRRAVAQLSSLASGSTLPPRLLGALAAPLPNDVMSGDDQRALEALTRASGPILSAAKSQLIGVSNIDQRAGIIRDVMKKSSLDPAIREAAATIVSKKCGYQGDRRWCTTPKGYVDEVKAIYAAVQNPNSPIAMRYARDHVTVDQFTLARKTIQTRSGDCDDGTVVLGALLMSIGYPMRMRIIQDSNSPTWSHIYPMVGLPPGNPTVWVPLDWSMYPFKPAGWEAPGASIVAATGRPAGIVVKVKDFDV